MRKSKFVVLTAALAGLAMPLAGLAASPNQLDEEIIAVSYADVDVDTAAGARTLYSRLRHASEKSCGVESYSVVRSLAEVTEARACYAETLARLVRQIDSAALDRLHNG